MITLPSPRTTSLSLLASINMPRPADPATDGDCIWMLPAGSDTLLLGLSTGAIGVACLIEDEKLSLNWTVQNSLKSKKLYGQLYLCACQVSSE